MGQIKDIIDKGYREIADRLISRKKHKEHFDDSTAPNSDNLPHHVSGFDDCNHIFYTMLEDVGKRAELEITHKSLFEFFGGHAFIDFGSIDTDGDVSTRLLETVDYKRIASILYYAKHHKSYDKELEEAYQEVVSHTANNHDNIDVWFSNDAAEKIEVLTEAHVKAAADETYDKVYDNPELEEKYRLSREDFNNQLINSEIVNIVSSRRKTQSADISCQNYLKALFIALTDEQFCSYADCLMDYYTPKYGTGIANDNVFSRYFQKTITPIAGYKFEEVKLFYPLERKFILNTLCSAYSDCVHFCFQKFNNARNLEYLIDEPNASRFGIIANYNDLKGICNIVKVYSQIIAVWQHIVNERHCKLYHRNDELDFIQNLIVNNIV